jgi:hypothetical protein
VLQQTARSGHAAGPATIQRQPKPPQKRFPTLPKKIIAGSTNLSRQTQAYAADHRVPGGTNLLAVEYSVGGGNRQVRVFENWGGVAHTEQIMEQYFRDLRGTVIVHAVYSERQPCGFSEQNCEKLLLGERYKNAEVTFAYNYQETVSPALESRAKRSRYLIDAHHERVYQSKQLEWDFLERDPPAHHEVLEPWAPSKRPRRKGDRGGTATPTVQGVAPGATEIPMAELSPRGGIKGAAAEAGAQLLLSMQLGNLRSAETNKAFDRLAELAPEIDRLVGEGYTVVVTVEAEVPTTLDIAAAGTGVGDPSQVVYFNKMYIKTATRPPRPLAPGETTHASYQAVGEIREGFGDPSQGEDPHELTLDQQIRAQPLPELGLPGDPDPARKHQPKHPQHRIIKRDQTFTPAGAVAPLVLPSVPQAPPPTPKPKLDEKTKRELAARPSRVYILDANIAQYRTAVEIEKKLAGNPPFVFVEAVSGGSSAQTRTLVVYWSDLDKARAEALAEIVRAVGVPTAHVDHDTLAEDPVPGHVQIMLGQDAER